LKGDKITIHSRVEGACSNSESLARQAFQKNSSVHDGKMRMYARMTRQDLEKFGVFWQCGKNKKPRKSLFAGRLERFGSNWIT